MKKMFFFNMLLAMTLMAPLSVADAFAQDRDVMPADAIIQQLSDQPDVKFRGIKIVGEPAHKAPAEAPQITFDIRFKFDSTQLADTVSQKQLEALATALQHEKFASAAFEIGGHTDSQGSTAYNLALSNKRAEAICAFLFRNGVKKNQVVAKGYGEAYPVTSNETELGRAQNRRVVVKRIDS